MDIHEFNKNRAAFPPEELLRYRGQYIAWSPDGSRIIASDKNGIGLDDTVRALDHDPATILFSFVPDEEGITIEDIRASLPPRQGTAILDMSQFDKNQHAFPPEELLPYSGRYIAWSPDGSRIIASNEDDSRLVAVVRELGYDPAETLISAVPDEEMPFLGGAALFMDMEEFNRNRVAFPPEELVQYRGQYIAFSPDGTRVIASDKDFLKLDDTVKALGYDPSGVVYETVPDIDIILGAGVMGD